jgi:hypothetical protein
MGLRQRIILYSEVRNGKHYVVALPLKLRRGKAPAFFAKLRAGYLSQK